MRLFQSFSAAITISMIAIAVTASLLVGGTWVVQEHLKFERSSVTIKENYLKEQREVIKGEVDRVIQFVQHKRTQTEGRLKANLRSRVEEAIAIANNIYSVNKDKLSDAEITRLITDALRPIRFNEGKCNFFIIAFDRTIIMTPPSRELEGGTLGSFKDKNGEYLYQHIEDAVRENHEGFFVWDWYHLADKSIKRDKIGFIKEFSPLGWWIGSNEYFDDFEEQVKREVLEWINAIRYGDDGYIFVTDYQGTTLAHYQEERIGKNGFNYRDTNNVAVLQELIRIAKKDGGEYLDYVGGIQPSTGAPGEKIGYARGIQDWRWMIGTGVYVDSINLQLDAMRKNLIQAIQKRILIICLALTVCILFISLVSRFLANKIASDLVVFTNFFKDAATSGRKISTEKFYFTELQGVAESANKMIDERNQSAVELAQVQSQLLQSKKMEALGLLAGGVAHDLNNVLSGMVGYPDLILKELSEESRQRKYLQKIKESGQRASEIVDDLLTLARRSVVQHDLVDLNALVNHYLHSPAYEKTFEKHANLIVETELNPALLKIKGSEIHIQKTIMNLVNNAMEAQPDGGKILIETANRYVDIQFMGYQKIDQGEYVVLTVSDKGTGIAAEDLDRIFEPFFSKKKLGRSGTGLGMAVVWGTMQDHKGYINLRSRPGEGTTFELYFPAARGNISEEVNQPEQAEFHGHGEHLLIVDDIAEQRDLAGIILQSLGYKTSAVSCGLEAVEYLKNKHADLVLLDMIMEDPDMDGLETYKQIVQFRPGQRVIITSGFAETDRVKAALTLGPSKYLKKPYTVETIRIAVGMMLDEK